MSLIKTNRLNITKDKVGNLFSLDFTENRLIYDKAIGSSRVKLLLDRRICGGTHKICLYGVAYENGERVKSSILGFHCPEHGVDTILSASNAYDYSGMHELIIT
jgi:hypothetical protein